jgi:hypothetical protein
LFSREAVAAAHDQSVLFSGIIPTRWWWCHDDDGDDDGEGGGLLPLIAGWLGVDRHHYHRRRADVAVAVAEQQQ